MIFKPNESTDWRRRKNDATLLHMLLATEVKAPERKLSLLGQADVAQEFAAPSERMIRIDGSPEARKTDVRLYTYDGDILLTAARLYQGQTTNFRTPGGGVAPVFMI